jgi:hypothetical protein
MNTSDDAHDPSVGVKRRHLPFAGSAKGEENCFKLRGR